jgi:flagellar hook-associated protein 3 FlgL
MNQLTQQIAALDRSLENVLRVQASVGARMNEIDSLQSAASDLDLQYSERLSNLQDLDYAKAISDLSRQQMQLEAAQQSFVRISGLSLFDVLG